MKRTENVYEPEFQVSQSHESNLSETIRVQVRRRHILITMLLWGCTETLENRERGTMENSNINQFTHVHVPPHPFTIAHSHPVASNPVNPFKME